MKNEKKRSTKEERERRLRERALAAARRYARFAHARPKRFAPGTPIPYGGRVFDEEEVAALVDASLDFWLTAGRYAARFERELAAYVGARRALLCASGSSANLLAFMALTSPELGERRVARGDEVITVAAGFPTTVAPVVQHGAVPVFVDVRLPGYNADCALLEKALSRRTKAVMLAHTLGNPFDARAVKDFCDRNGLWLVEDNCDALGARVLVSGAWARTGSVGHLATCSFYPAHHITTGEGGAVLTSDERLGTIVASLRDWGRDCVCPSGRDNTCGRRFDRRLGELPHGYDHKYVYSRFGYNLKATEMQAAIGCAQLAKLPGFVERRRENWRRLREGLDDLAGAFVLPEPTPGTEPSWFGFVLTVREGAPFGREEVVRRLEAHGVQTRMLFAGNLLRHPCFDELRASGAGYRVAGELATTDAIMRRTFWVGVYPGMTPAMLDYVAGLIRQAAAPKR